MRYFGLRFAGNLNNPDYCFVPTPPRGGKLTAYNLKTGKRVADKYPGGIGEVTLQLGEDYPGLELTSYIGNTDSMLVVDRKTADIIQSHRVGEIELIPFKLLNHKGRVHSSDYVFVNPIGAVDCLNYEKSSITRDEDDGSLVRVDKVVLAANKLSGAPDLFRIKDAMTSYVFSEALVSDLRDKGCTNFVFEELPQA
jgi:hypothetical protein